MPSSLHTTSGTIYLQLVIHAIKYPYTEPNNALTARIPSVTAPLTGFLHSSNSAGYSDDDRHDGQDDTDDHGCKPR